MLPMRWLWVGLLFAVITLGCGSSVREETIEVKAANDPLHAPRSILQRYADGQALGSEVESFPKLVEDVQQVDPARAQILEKGLKDIRKAAPASRPSLAKALLTKLQPSIK
jgi:hypothetical protein